MTKPKAKKAAKSEATISGQLNEAVDYTNTPDIGSVERFRMSANTLEEHIATRVRNYWKERGYHVNVAVQEIVQVNKSGSPHSIYRAARSNMTGGLPPGCKELSFGIDPHTKPKPKRSKRVAQYE
jgi:hypothetical protein